MIIDRHPQIQQDKTNKKKFRKNWRKNSKYSPSMNMKIYRNQKNRKLEDIKLQLNNNQNVAKIRLKLDQNSPKYDKNEDTNN